MKTKIRIRRTAFKAVPAQPTKVSVLQRIEAASVPLILLILLTSRATPAFAQTSGVDEAVVFAEENGLIAVEAEHFYKQSAADVRRFYLTHSQQTPEVTPDGDPPHVGGASGGAYLEILPDTRRTHADKLIHNENFSPDPGKMAILHYKVNIATPGRYYVWVRAHSTGSEDNGLHVGIDGTWPASGQRLQWCEGKHAWRWDSKQRTQEQHCGEAHKIFLDVATAGEHEIHFSMREDGFEFDKWLMTMDRGFVRPAGHGPESSVTSGNLPDAFPAVAAPKTAATDNKTPEPIADAQMNKRAVTAFHMTAKMFSASQLKGYYLDKGKWMAVDPDKNKSGSVQLTFPWPTGTYNVTLQTVGEDDGQSTFRVRVDDTAVGDFTCPLSTETYAEGAAFRKTWKNIQITEGAMIGVSSEIASKDGQEFSRARWSAVTFRPADQVTMASAAPLLKQAQRTQGSAATSRDRSTSPTVSTTDEPLQLPRQPDGDGSVTVSGEAMVWHKLTVDLAGPYAHEKDNLPNPFTDYRMTVTFKHPQGDVFAVPGYFAADGDAANSSSESGTTWRAHFSPNKPGNWKYQVRFRHGKRRALDDDAPAREVAPFDGQRGVIAVKASNKATPDLRAQGRLQYVGKHYLQFAGSGQYFLKVGADAPETLLAFVDFDNTIAGNAKKAPLKKWAAHVSDWKDGDPTWQGDKGKGLIGAVNYLSSKGCNVFSFLTYNAGGDGDNVWPFIQREDKLHYDCSKLDQWGVLFDHGTAKGMYLHFKMQETENDDHNRGKRSGYVPECLDGGNLGIQRKLYCRELIARFGHNLALNWNLGEENTQSTEQQQAMINYISSVDPYNHNIVIHTFPDQQNKIYRPLLGDKSKLTGVSLQNSSLRTTHSDTVKWVRESAAAGRPWIVAFDESGSASHAQSPDLGYRGFDGHDRNGKMSHTQHEVRKQTLWGTLMAGGAGNEYYFGYQYVENDIVCEDWRSRDQSWDYCRIAINFFHENNIPFWDMKNADELVGNPEHDISKFCFAKTNDTYLVYLPQGGKSMLNLSAATGDYSIHWFNPRTGGDLQQAELTTVSAGNNVSIGAAPAGNDDDWLAVVRRK